MYLKVANQACNNNVLKFINSQKYSGNDSMKNETSKPYDAYIVLHMMLCTLKSNNGSHQITLGYKEQPQTNIVILAINTTVLLKIYIWLLGTNNFIANL